jgi:hypothetical protein
MRRALVGTIMLALPLVGCESDEVLVPVDGPAPPRALDAYYFGGVVTVTWELASSWDGETFRVYSRRVTDSDYFFIAEVTSCGSGFCSYEDRNILPGQTYEYYVAAVDPASGIETASDYSVEVFVPQPVPPPVPAGLEIVALDGANYLRWRSNAREESDFSFYRVYFESADGSEYFLGETDSEGFLDRLVVNGETYVYSVTSVDDQGHESTASAPAAGTPRPDYHGEWVYDYFDQPDFSGFRFQSDETTYPVVSGIDPARHFRLEVDDFGWWLVPGPGTAVHDAGPTTALKCGVAADADCIDVTTAPTSGYTIQDMALSTQTSYVLRVQGDDGLTHYGVIRVEVLGFDQDGYALMIFDWAYQLQAGNPDLAAGR